MDEGEEEGEHTHLFTRRPATVIGVVFLVDATVDIIVIKDTGD